MPFLNCRKHNSRRIISCHAEKNPVKPSVLEKANDRGVLFLSDSEEAATGRLLFSLKVLGDAGLPWRAPLRPSDKERFTVVITRPRHAILGPVIDRGSLRR
ncbi:hypothetical protein AAFF_G00093270 [Aldrovandia affinis]|uniref:Uncharacterized protein n=1 Tax=Aldrovandia affinis TaxID=143900 RepID=A0AAD7T4K0_9TELE|nr:hypothetical protein AAFF_G00093270 [Aldrovandia affinis]